MMYLRMIAMEELTMSLFENFNRYQVVNQCVRKSNHQWVIQEDPFIDDWSQEDYQFLVKCLQHTLLCDGVVCGAFVDNQLKGFVSIEGERFGSQKQYLDLSSLHVSYDCRGQGIGKALFLQAKTIAKQKGALKLYISSHSAIETQAFYHAMGCYEALEYHQEHVMREPFDCQLECEL